MRFHGTRDTRTRSVCFGAQEKVKKLPERMVDQPRFVLLTCQAMSVSSKVPEVGNQRFDWGQRLACDDESTTEVAKWGADEAR